MPVEETIWIDLPDWFVQEWSLQGVGVNSQLRMALEAQPFPSGNDGNSRGPIQGDVLYSSRSCIQSSKLESLLDFGFLAVCRIPGAKQSQFEEMKFLLLSDPETGTRGTVGRTYDLGIVDVMRAEELHSPPKRPGEPFEPSPSRRWVHCRDSRPFKGVRPGTLHRILAALPR